jgi:hypothetical protein
MNDAFVNLIKEHGHVPMHPSSPWICISDDKFTIRISDTFDTGNNVVAIEFYNGERWLKEGDILFLDDSSYVVIPEHYISRQWELDGFYKQFNYRVIKKEEFEQEVSCTGCIPDRMVIKNGLGKLVIDDKETLKNSYIYNFPDMAMTQFIDDLIELGFERFPIFSNRACLYIDKQGIIRT